MLNCNYYNEIKNELINNEIYKRVKDYSKNRNELSVYYNVGKLLSEAGKHYGEGIIKEYSRKLTIEIGSGYGISNLKRMRQFYLIVEKGVALPHQLSWSHILAILPINNINEINYYISISIEQNLSYRQLREKIKSKEYQRLDDKTKLKLINKEETVVSDFIKNPIVIKNKYNIDKKEITEKILKKLNPIKIIERIIVTITLNQIFFISKVCLYTIFIIFPLTYPYSLSNEFSFAKPLIVLESGFHLFFFFVCFKYFTVTFSSR